MSSALVLLVLAGCAEPPPWEFVSTKHKFKVRFGSEPKVRADPRQAAYSVKRDDGALTVYVMDFDQDVPPETVPLALKTVKDNVIRAAHGAELSDASVTLAGKYPGREFTARVGDPQPGLMRTRVYLVGKRLYQVMVLGTEEFVNSRNAKAFWESFTVME